MRVGRFCGLSDGGRQRSALLSQIDSLEQTLDEQLSHIGDPNWRPKCMECQQPITDRQIPIRPAGKVRGGSPAGGGRRPGARRLTDVATASPPVAGRKTRAQIFHEECFKCAKCGRIFYHTAFIEQDGKFYCPADHKLLFSSKCAAWCVAPALSQWVRARAEEAMAKSRVPRCWLAAAGALAAAASSRNAS